MHAESYRHELKFLCTENQLCHIERKIRHICRLDRHTGPDGNYRITSLYFDTPDDRCYQENLAGTDQRKKYRIRVYNDDTDTIFLECKSSLRGLKTKENCLITPAQCEYLTEQFPYWKKKLPAPSTPQTDPSQNLLERFLTEKKTELFLPKVIVEYVRTPYIFPAGNVRITFDRRIRSSSQVTGFPGKSRPFRCILPQDTHVLEVKYDRLLPGAILELVTGGLDLRRTSFSKYAMCREYGTI